jgi:phosphonate transport system substrate-binding protein
MMISYLRQAKIDWVSETPFSAVMFVEKGDAEILLRRWKKGVSQYRAVFFAHKKSAIHSLQDLRGKKIAFEDPDSTSAYLLPAATLIQSGFELVQLATPREKPPQDMVGYTFAHKEVNAPMLVYRGLMDAGVLSNLDWEEKDRTLESIKDELDIFHQTANVPRALELVRRSLKPEIKRRLKSVLLKAPWIKFVIVQNPTWPFWANDW